MEREFYIQFSFILSKRHIHGKEKMSFISCKLKLLKLLCSLVCLNFLCAAPEDFSLPGDSERTELAVRYNEVSICLVG